MTRSDVWQQRARDERGLILQVLYNSVLPDVAVRTIEGACRSVLMPIEPEHLEAHLRDLAQRGYIARNDGETMGLMVRTCSLMPAGRDVVLGAVRDPSIELPAEMV